MQAFELYNLFPPALDSVAWGVLARQLPTVAVLCAVCSLGTSMDVMAVQAEVPWELDSDREISALGVGNFLAGVFGGGVGPGAHLEVQPHCSAATPAVSLLAQRNLRGVSLLLPPRRETPSRHERVVHTQAA
jgi:hypothetical protein